MFEEQTIPKGEKKNSGWIEVICGSMFSGKTEELIRRLNRSLIAKRTVEIFKPTLDNRYHKSNIVSHNAHTIHSTAIKSAKNALLYSTTCDVVGIDEAQFFDNSLLEVSNHLASLGKRVIIAGLDMNFRGEPFGPIPNLLAQAEYVTKLHAICMRCGALASYSYRLTNNKQKIILGEQDLYEARCRKCFLKG